MAHSSPQPEERGCWAFRDPSGAPVDPGPVEEPPVTAAELLRERDRLLKRHNDIVFRVPPDEEYKLEPEEREELTALRAALDDLDRKIAAEGKVDG